MTDDEFEEEIARLRASGRMPDYEKWIREALAGIPFSGPTPDREFSERSRKVHEKAVAQIRASLAARDALGRHRWWRRLRWRRRGYDSRQQVRDFLDGVQKGFEQARREREAK